MFFSKKKKEEEKMKQIKEEIKELIDNADACLIFTGAGMGIDSGLSVFRGKEGLWEKYPDAKGLNLGFKDLANPNNYALYPEVVMPFYLDRYKSYVNAEPHSGYYELFGFAETLPFKYFTITSNVDGMFEKAGFDKDRIHEEHGSIHHWQCSNYHCSRTHKEKGLVDISNKNLDDFDALRCGHCNERLRPNICMFFDADWMDSIYDKQENLERRYMNNLLEKKKVNVVVIEIGAGEDIRTIRSKSELAAFDFYTKLIRINPDQEESFSDKYTIHINESAAKGISMLFDHLDEKK